MTAKTKTPEQIRAEAQRLAEEAAKAQAAVDELTLREYEAEQEAQAERDRQTVANFNRAELDQAVDEARQAFEEAVAEWPVTKALAEWQAAGYRRNWAYLDVNGARGRLGLNEGGNAPAAFVSSIADAIDTAATRLAQAAIDEERSGQ